MRLSEIQGEYAPIKIFEDIDPKFTNYIPHIRVLAAPYINDTHIHFTLKAYYKPGENKYFPDGGFEVYTDNGGVYSFRINQVIVHPLALGLRNFKFDNDKDKPTREIKIEEPKGPHKKRGRKALTSEEIAKRENEKTERTQRSGGKRGRPKKQ
jgi:signal peptidase I